MARFRSSPETFLVEEIPAYTPAGAGSHTFVWIEKRGLTTLEAIRRIARALSIGDRDLGYAGMKDRHATTRQWISVPDLDPERAVALEVDGVRVLDARRHGNKLRIGHLRANQFEVRLEDVSDEEGDALAGRLRALAGQGLVNRYGRQRFGAAGDNVSAAAALLQGQRRERDGRRRRLLLSAMQSAVFNRVVALREETGGLLRVRPGDVLQKVDSGGLFITSDPTSDQARVDAKEVVPTGPLPGTREREPPPGTEARALEDRALDEIGIARADLERQGRDLPGARRPVVVPVTLGDPPCERGPGTLLLRFALPAGSYATVLLEALDPTLMAEETVRDGEPLS